MLDDGMPAMAPELEAAIDSPAPNRDPEVFRAYATLRDRMAGELIFHLATGEGARVPDVVRTYSILCTSQELEGVEALLSTLDEATAIRGVSATAGTQVLLVILDAEERYLAHVFQPRAPLQ